MVTSSERRDLVSWYEESAQPAAIVAKSAVGLIIIGITTFSFTNTFEDQSGGAEPPSVEHLQTRAMTAARALGVSVEGKAEEPSETATEAAPGAQHVLSSPPAANGR